ncbi:MAG: acetyltransferase [Actinomycetota bacterium]|nr:acetyltransferase [Actinomycetota bacterium]
MRVRPGSSSDFPRLTSIWFEAVSATHDFLSPEEIEGYRRRMASEFLPAVELWVGVDEDDGPVGFIGLGGSHVEMLFVDVDHHGGGVGTALIEFAAERHPGLTVDVNEQNPSAVAFYESCGFVRTGRSPVDADGRPFPLIHLHRSPA